MSLAIHNSEGVRRINLLGEVRDLLERQLLAALAEAGPEPVEVSFYDAPMVSENVVLALSPLEARGDGSRIVVYHPSLAHYFHQLGLAHRYKDTVRKPVVDQPVTALALGGSADSLDKIIAIIERLPDSALVVFIVQHIPEDRPNGLDQLLRTRTGYALLIPHHMTPIRPGTIFIAPPGHHLRVHSGQVYLTRDRKVNYAQPAIDVLFESLAREYGPGLLAALLCGFGRDGVDGLGLIRENKGLALVEKSRECAAPMMVERAVAEKKYDLILSWKEIASFFAAAARPEPPPDGRLLTTFLEAVEERYGYAFHAYAEGTLQRRIAKLMMESGFASFYGFQKAVLSSTACFESLFLQLSIGVTAFFRHPEQLRHLREHIFPYLRSFPLIRIWIAGCASGETAYSLALILEETGLLDKAQIYATDINPVLLRQARNGLYGKANLPEAQQFYTRSGGRGQLSDFFDIRGRFMNMPKRLKSKILFYHLSLVGGGVFNEFQLILCSNVIIYFNKALQSEVMTLFSRSLHRDGFLMLGPNESIQPGNGERFFQEEHKDMRLYRWKRNGDG